MWKIQSISFSALAWEKADNMIKGWGRKRLVGRRGESILLTTSSIMSLMAVTRSTETRGMRVVTHVSDDMYGIDCSSNHIIRISNPSPILTNE